MEHEDIDPFAPRHRVDRRRTGIATGRADDGQRRFTRLDEAFEEQSQQLQRHVLERQRRAMEEFEQEMPVVELNQWGDRSMGEAAISLLA